MQLYKTSDILTVCSYKYSALQPAVTCIVNGEVILRNNNGRKHSQASCWNIRITSFLWSALLSKMYVMSILVENDFLIRSLNS